MITLNNEATEVNIGGLVIKLNQNIDFKPDSENKLTVGKVEEFRNVYNDPFDTSKGVASVWMKVKEIETKQKHHWVSLTVWTDQYHKGLFTNKLPEPETLINASTELTDDDLPF